MAYIIFGMHTQLILNWATHRLQRWLYVYIHMLYHVNRDLDF